MSSLTTAGSSMEEEEFHTRLSLEIGDTSRRRAPQTRKVKLFGEMIVSPQEDHGGRDHHAPEPAAVIIRKKRAAPEIMSGSADIISNNKKAACRTTSSQAQRDGGDRCSPSDGGGGARKKLRLTTAQATMLEDSFRAHNILSHAQKQELARRVGLSARQVEVWFQNRRARTKLKQTEVDCELLRRWCDRLTDENARLRRDLADLRAGAAAGAGGCPACCHKKMTMRMVASNNVA